MMLSKTKDTGATMPADIATYLFTPVRAKARKMTRVASDSIAFF